METIRIKFSPFIALLACAAALAGAADQGPKAQLHYAFRHKGQEMLTINWEGSVNWDTHVRLVELWVRKDGQTYLILDKATLAAMDQATEPLRHYPHTGDPQSDQKAREVQRNGVYAATDKIVQDAMSKGLGRPAKFQ
jgi:hypothetical protein